MKTTCLAGLLAVAGTAMMGGCGARPDALPATRNAGGLTVTLAAVKPARDDPAGKLPYETEGSTEAGVSWQNSAPRKGGRRARMAEACLELQEAGRPADEWRIARATVTGPRGGVIRDAVRQQEWATGGRQYLWLEGPREGRVWRVALDFIAADSYQGFQRDQLWTVGGLKVPRGHSAMSMPNTHAKVAGVDLDLVALVPPGRATYRDGSLAEFEAAAVSEGVSVSWPAGGMVVAASRPSVVVALGQPAEGRQLSVRATDDRGRSCPQVSSCQGDGPAGKGTLRVMALNVPDDSRTLDLTFVVQEPHTVEFVVRRP
jgi:hypothetical protein